MQTTTDTTYKVTSLGGNQYKAIAATDNESR